MTNFHPYLQKLELHKVNKHEFDKCVDIWVESFVNYPWYLYLLNSDEYCKKKVSAFCEVVLRSALEVAEVFAISNTIEGFHICIPPNRKVSPLRFIKNGGLGLLWKMYPGILNRLLRYENFAEEIRLRYCKDPHWYMLNLAIDIEHQGKGYARKLFDPVTEHCDDNNLYSFLETHKEDNTKIYERFGYEVVEELRLPDSDIIHYAMLRRPVS